VSNDVLARKRAQIKKLYEVGQNITVSDDVLLWLQKLSPLEEKEAVSKSYKPRAAILALLKTTPDDPAILEFTDTMDRIGLDSREARISFLIAPDVQKEMLSCEARIGAEKEWDDNDYLKSLQGAWTDGLSDKWALDQDDPEASRVYKELRRYTDQVEAAVEIRRADLYDRMNDKDDDDIIRRTVKVLVEHAAGAAQVDEYNAWAIFFATRLDEDHDVRFFDSRDDVEAYGGDLYSTLLTKYIEMVTDDLEGKD